MTDTVKLPDEKLSHIGMSSDKAADVWLALRKAIDEDTSFTYVDPLTTLEKKLYDALTARLACEAAFVLINVKDQSNADNPSQPAQT